MDESQLDVDLDLVETVCLRSDILADRWKGRFVKFEPARVMSMDEFVRMLCSPGFQHEIDSHTIQTLWQKCVDHTRSTVTYQQFVNVLGCFVPYKLFVEDVWTNGPVPIDSYFIYRADKRTEIWRYLLYPLTTSGWIHLAFNMLVQLLVGLPLEMVHGSLRVAAIYIAAVLAGSLGTSLFDNGVFLVGCSGGAYCLLFAQFTFTITNFTHVKISYFPLPTVVVICFADLGYAVWTRYTAVAHRLSYTSHLVGMFIGATLGCVILFYYKQKLYKQPICWIAVAAYFIFVIFSVFWIILYR